MYSLIAMFNVDVTYYFQCSIGVANLESLDDNVFYFTFFYVFYFFHQKTRYFTFFLFFGSTYLTSMDENVFCVSESRSGIDRSNRRMLSLTLPSSHIKLRQTMHVRMFMHVVT